MLMRQLGFGRVESLVKVHPVKKLQNRIGNLAQAQSTDMASYFIPLFIHPFKN